MKQRWEYLVVFYQETTQIDTAGNRTWNNSYHVIHPEANKTGTRSADTATWAALLNEFGSEGWELISDSTVDTTVVGHKNGWMDVGVPIRMMFTFKRPAD
jgi:hypothetical protein